VQHDSEDHRPDGRGPRPRLTEQNFHLNQRFNADARVRQTGATPGLQPALQWALDDFMAALDWQTITDGGCAKPSDTPSFTWPSTTGYVVPSASSGSFPDQDSRKKMSSFGNVP
jgi:hypothetical protein